MTRYITHLLGPVVFTILFGVTSAHGQPSCSNAILQGSYGLHATGAGGNFAAVGRFTFDGKGNLTGTLFARIAGNDVELHITGTYAVHSDCTVDDTWNFSGNSSTHKSVIVDQGQGYFILNNTSGDSTIISGEARKQFAKDENND